MNIFSSSLFILHTFVCIYFTYMKESVFKNKWVTFVLHTAFWTLLFLLPYLLQPSSPDRPANRTPRPPQSIFNLFNLIKAIFWVALFYFNAYVLVPAFIHKKKLLHYIFSLVLVIGLLSLLEMLHFSMGDHGRAFRISGVIFFNLFPFLFIITASTAYRMFTDRAAQEKKLREREAENLKSELSFLRSQISPHFIFNVLNNIVALVRKGSDQVEPTLIKLSTIMRYFLYENASDTISLEKEIEYLKNYIELQEQRFSNATIVRFTIKGPDASYQIEPMLMIPFVENAFKHGLIQNGSILIELEALKGMLNFSVKNRYQRLGNEIKDQISGIGLANVKRRLNLLYQQKHTLTIDDSNEAFIVSLQLKLH